MRAFLDILGFELRLHTTSPLFQGTALLFFLLHLLTLTQTGVHLSDNDLIDINSAWLIFQTELILGFFGMLPAIIFVVTAITRDHERDTAALFFTTPVPRLSWLLGRFSAGTLAAVSVGFAGLLGSLAGSFMPWVDQNRIGPFDWQPYAVSFGALALPNLLVFCVFFFSIAALTRSAALTFGAALGLLVLEVVVHNNAVTPVPQWLLLADPFASLPVAEAARYWTVSELNSQLPTAFLLPNRLLWLGLASLALAFTGWRYRMDLAPAAFSRERRARKAATPPPILREMPYYARFDTRATLLQFRSQLLMDFRCVLQSALFWLVLLLGVWGTSSEVRGISSSLIGLPLYPVTSLMLGFFRYGLLQFVLLLIIYYSAVLVHRERDCGVDGMTGAAPCLDWIMAVSKTLVLCGIVSLLLLVSMLTCIALQAMAGYSDFEIGLYLQGLFVYNGSYFYMLCVLGILVQVLSPGKWSGMILLLLVFIALMSLDALGFEHLLYGFRIPDVVYSDMNGFGHFRLPTYTLIAYWSAFCALLLVLGHLLYPRGYYASFRERLRDAQTRIVAPVTRTSAVALVSFVGLGVFIFYNTNVLNDYTTRDADLKVRARYELDYGRYRNAPAPSFLDVDLQVELYPDERRLETRGTAVLRNNKQAAIGEFAVAIDPRMRVSALTVEGATTAIQDAAQGFYLFALVSPLQPGATLTMRWDLARMNRGFVNSSPDNEVVANGTFVNSADIMPLPGYDEERELTGNGERARFGLPPAARLPALGDPAHLDDLGFGVDSRSSFRVVFGTGADQTAVAPGVLIREWVENGRRYFKYAMERPIWPVVSLSSARYTVARDDWNDVALEVYHDAKHPWNVPTMLATARTGLEYFSREFAPYPLSYFRILEYPRYRSGAQAFPGTIPYAESVGFTTDLRGWAGLDYATLHELAHQWWGGMAYGARMQGRQLLNETLAQYSTFMAFKQYADPVWLRRILAYTHNGYLDARGNETVAEQPVLLTEDQGYISYNKAALALFALQELIGAERVHQALRSYLRKFAEQDPPFPTSRDLVDELRAVAGPEYQTLITDLFEKIMLYDASVVAAEARPAGNGYEVTLEVAARQYEANGTGEETEVPLDTWFQIAVFPESDRGVMELAPLYLEQHRLRSGTQRITVRVPEKPGAVGVDPFHLMIDRTPDNNVKNLLRQ